MAEPTTKQTGESVTAFLDRVTEGERRTDCSALVRLMKEAAKAPPKMWGASIVGFGSYEITYAGGRVGQWPIVAFSPRKADLTLYVSASKAPKLLLKQLGKHKVSGGCLHIKRLSEVDLGILKRLVAGSVKQMMEKQR